MSKDLGDVHGECKAYAALATAYQELGQPQDALEYLKHYLIFAEKIGTISW